MRRTGYRVYWVTGIEWAAEAGWTRAYSRVGDVGILRHVLYFTVFMAAVEAGVWAVHKWLHTQAFYRYISTSITGTYMAAHTGPSTGSSCSVVGLGSTQMAAHAGLLQVVFRCVLDDFRMLGYVLG